MRKVFDFIADVWDGFWWSCGDFIRFIGGVLLFVSALLALLAGAGFAITLHVDPKICAAQTAEMRMESQWSLLGGCRVKTDNEGWIPLENFRVEGR